MFWETCAALLLILVSIPLWMMVAVLWGIIKSVLSMAGMSIDVFSETPLPWGDIWIIPVVGLIEGLAAAWSIPSSIWYWAKFDHPWWATLIAFVLFGLTGRR